MADRAAFALCMRKHQEKLHRKLAHDKLQMYAVTQYIDSVRAV